MIEVEGISTWKSEIDKRYRGEVQYNVSEGKITAIKVLGNSNIYIGKYYNGSDRGTIYDRRSEIRRSN